MDYKSFVEKRLKDHPNRLKHTFGVYNRALELGKLYNADLEVLKVASLLHDVTKCEKDSFHRKLIDDEKIILKYPKKMWHAFSAAKVAEELKIENKKIIEAIKYHIFGKIEMGLETMILCVSDFCEENRTFNDAKKVYEKALKNLKEAYILTVELIIEHLKKQEIKPIKEQTETYLYYKKKGEDKQMDLLKKTVNALKEVKITDYKSFDLDNANPFYNYVIIASANKRQANSLLGYLKEELKNAYEIKGVEGKGSGWLLIDLGNLIVHVFDLEAKDYYKFEEKFVNIKEIKDI